jgi:hypothetical protein
MSRLRDDVRNAFERDQLGLGDVGDARHRLMHDALASRDVATTRRVQWAAGIAAVVIAAILIATFAIARAGSHSHALPALTSSPRAAASPTPLTNTLTVSDSTPLILYSDPAKAGQIDGITWDGKSSGKLAYQQQNGFVGNPQNNLFADASLIVDRSGNVVMTGTFGAKYFTGTWADDGRSICEMVPFSTTGSSAVPTTLRLVTVGQGIRDLASIGMLNEQTFVRVAACSTLTDRAVVVQSGGQGLGTVGVWVVQLSTGKLIWTHAYDVPTTIVSVVASRDGMYVAENLDRSGPAGSTVYGPDGRAITQLASSVELFSWDGTLAVVDNGYGTTPVDVISWRVGTVMWSCPSAFGLSRAEYEPGGPDLAVWVAPTADFQQQTLHADLYVLSPTGLVITHITRTGSA